MAPNLSSDAPKFPPSRNTEKPTVTDAKVLNKEDSEPVSEAVEPDDGVAEPGSEPVQVEGKKGARSRRPNYNIYGPDWV